ncbi:AsnC family transcriptional regulator [Arhodomonas sp. AD133]|uniref:AsnC family transcriptional regulator n=1 Tax=Arhodomonas sp. AD133 TaxID=3415009 RepID=UPI003EBB19B2
MEPLDRRIVNELQGGFPVCEAPYAAAAATLGITEAELVERIRRLLDEGVLSRFGPLYNAERMGGAVTLAAMAVPDEHVDGVAARINARPEVAHNYERTHRLNLWFVVCVDDPQRLPAVLDEIEYETGMPVYDMPKEREYYIGLRIEA